MSKLDFLKQRVNLSTLKEIKLFNVERNIVFVDIDFYIGELKPGSTLILSPSFYWIKREILPIKYPFEAKKLLPSLFDGVVPEGEFTYRAFKESRALDVAHSTHEESQSEEGEDSNVLSKISDLLQKGSSKNYFTLIAYSDKDIVKNLQKLSIKESYIKDIYFAQSEFENIKEPLKISNNYSLVCKDKIVCKIPNSFVSNSVPIEEYLESFKLTKSKISVNIFSHSIVDTKTLKRASIAASLFIVSFGVSYYLDTKTMQELVDKRASIASYYSLPPTQIQLNSLKQRLERESKNEIDRRESIAYILNSPLIKNSEYFSEFRADPNGYFLQIELKEAKRAETLKEYLEKRLEISNIRVSGLSMRVEVRL